jgi:hypothetical protein
MDAPERVSALRRKAQLNADIVMHGEEHAKAGSASKCTLHSFDWPAAKSKCDVLAFCMHMLPPTHMQYQLFMTWRCD